MYVSIINSYDREFKHDVDAELQLFGLKKKGGGFRHPNSFATRKVLHH